ncbi:NAD-dependent epimerase/dehydratase family protein [Lachnospiraceae bacterium 38-10]
MYRVLITGAESYVGTSFEKWNKENAFDLITVDTVDVRGNEWKEYSFSNYNTVFHVAGLAHVDIEKVTTEQKQRYYEINTELAVECAKKAREEGVKQFIFMSSMIVYGESGGIGRKKVITKNTPLSPANFYGDSKAKAEQGLRRLETEKFKVVILRPPMIYGKGSKGNYPLLVKIAKSLPAFPKEKNERSMLYIGNLCKFVSLMILNEESGIFFPQNAEYVKTGELVKMIAEAKGKKVYLTNVFHPVLILVGKMDGKIGNLVNKAFGNMVYEKEMSEYKEEYRQYDFRESVYLTENG